MFKEEYQGGTHVEIFTVNAREPLKDWKFSGSGSYEKVYEKEAKGFVLLVKGHAGATHIQLPKDSKQNLFLIQPFFVVQVNVHRLSEFYVELTVRDVRGTRRRLFFSSNQKDVASTALHARLPLSGLQSNVWTNLCLDLPSFVSHCWPNSVFHSVATILLAGSFRLRKIFTLKVPPPPTSIAVEEGSVFIDQSHGFEHLPKNCDFPIEVAHVNQLVSISSVQKHISSAPPNSSRSGGGGGSTQVSCAGSLVVTGVGSSTSTGGSAMPSSRVTLSAGEKVPEPPPVGKKRSSVVRRIAAGGSVGESSPNDADLCVSGTSSSKSKPAGNSARSSSEKSSLNRAKMSNKTTTSHHHHHHTHQPLPSIESSSNARRASVSDSVCETIDMINDELNKHLAVSNSSNKNNGKKSDVPKLPAVRQTYSLVAAEQSLLAVSKTTATTKPAVVESEIVDFEFDDDDDDEITWSVIHDQNDLGPNLRSDFEPIAQQQQICNYEEEEEEERKAVSVYDANRYVDDDDDEELRAGVVEKKTSKDSDAENNKLESGGKDATTPVSETQASVASEQSEVELLFDPVINCYFDPKTGKYFELVS